MRNFKLMEQRFFPNYLMALNKKFHEGNFNLKIDMIIVNQTTCFEC